MNVSGNFVYDTTGNLIEDKSKRLKISYDWRGMAQHEQNAQDYFGARWSGKGFYISDPAQYHQGE